MTDFSISQFKQHVANLINAAGLDSNNNGVIETKNGELAKVLSNFGIKESQIGDLLEKTDSSQTATRASSKEKPYPEDVHKQFIDAYKNYDKLSEEQKYNVRKETMKQAAKNFSELQDSRILVTKLTDDLKNDIDKLKGISDKKDLKDFITEKVLSYANSAYNTMSENIERYDSAFSKYDITYRSPYEIKQNAAGRTPYIKNVADMCMLKVTTKLGEFAAINPDSMNIEEYAQAALEMYIYVDAFIRATNENIERNAQSNFEQYREQFKNSLYALDHDIIRQWMPPLDNTPHEEEPDTIAIEGAPIEKTFTDVVNNTTTGIKDAQNNTQQPDGKFVKDGKIYIRKNSQVYDLNGHKVQEN